MIQISSDEAIEILVSVLAISLGFTIVFAGIGGLLKYPKEFLVFMGLSLVTIGSGFILHEMGHKISAIYFGYHAQFRMWIQGLVVMLLGSLVGVLFAAPGAVYIYSRHITKRENGIISIAGPMVNLILLAVFVGLEYFAPVTQYFSFLNGMTMQSFGIVNSMLHVWKFGATVNLMLALFNMIPAFPLDGSKIFVWSKTKWAGMVILLMIVGVGVLNLGIGLVIMWALILFAALIFSKMAFGGRG